jgi:hypothetical protein
MTKTLKNILYGTLILTLGSVFSMKDANGQIKYVNNMKEADKEIKKAEDLNKERLNTLYLGFEPVDMGLGARYNRKISSDFGLYTSFSHGNFKFKDRSYIKNHNKAVLGGLIYLKKNSDDSRGFFSGGLSYHTFGERNCDPNVISKRGFKHFSGELGVGARTGRFDGAVSYDFKCEGIFYVGFNFGPKR